MKFKNKYVLKMEDGRNEPIKDLENASRLIFIDEERVGAKDITFGYSKWAPNMSFHKKHAHENAEEIMYILSGRLIAGVKDQEAEVVKGDTIWVPMGAVHWAYNPFEEPCEFVFMYTRASFQSAGYEIVE
jgi:mannose-6-phosphate isomerase-like protein (cupin superfamily)